MIRVGFDISQLAHQGGVNTYTQNLAKELSKKPDLDMNFFYSSMRKPYKGNLKNVKSFRLPPTLFQVLFNQIRNVSIEKFIGDVDVFHSSDWVQPPSKAKKVTTYHDVIPLKYPQWSHPRIVSVHKKRLELVEKEIDCVIAVSEATKKDLMEISKIPESKIVVIYEAAGDQFKILPKVEVDKFRKDMNLPDKFVLAIGKLSAWIDTRRNIDRVKHASKNYPLIITGENLPQLPYDKLPLLYNCATVLLYPSLYEGFGLPVLEAISCGVPVITSNVSSMPEVGGQAALYVDPENQDEIDGTLKKVMESEKLRQELREKGLKRAKAFSWHKTAEETAEVYRRLVK